MSMDEIVVNTKALGSQADPRVVAARFGFQAVWADIDERAIKAADISEDWQRAGPEFVVDEPPGPPSDEARDLASPGPLQAKSSARLLMRRFESARTIHHRCCS